MKWSAMLVAFLIALVEHIYLEIRNIHTAHKRFYAWCKRNDARWDGYIDYMHEWTRNK